MCAGQFRFVGDWRANKCGISFVALPNDGGQWKCSVDRATRTFNIRVQRGNSGRKESSGCCYSSVTGEPGIECSRCEENHYSLDDFDADGRPEGFCAPCNCDDSGSAEV